MRLGVLTVIYVAVAIVMSTNEGKSWLGNLANM